MLINNFLKSRSVVFLLTGLSVHIAHTNHLCAFDEAKNSETDAVETEPKDETAAVKHPANRLAKESSPYLLMHAHNPVDWYPWGPEAFEKAKKEEKLIFLSVGYSSCYWCHVMERKTFSNEKVAEFLNKHFVCIKVDREERPDIDDIYMTSLIVYLQAAGSRGGGGWPLSLFLTPDGQPIAGATYLPPEDTAEGGTGFLTAAGRIQEEDRAPFVDEGAAGIGLDFAGQATASPVTPGLRLVLGQMLSRSVEIEGLPAAIAPGLPLAIAPPQIGRARQASGLDWWQKASPGDRHTIDGKPRQRLWAHWELVVKSETHALPTECPRLRGKVNVVREW